MWGSCGWNDRRSCLSSKGVRIRSLVVGLCILQAMIWENADRFESPEPLFHPTALVAVECDLMNIHRSGGVHESGSSCKPWMIWLISSNRGLGHVSAGRQRYGMR